MAHEIEASDKLVLVGDKAWHGIGEVLPTGTVLTPSQAVAQALPWEPVEVKLVREDSYSILDSHKAIVRSDTKDLLSVVSAGYNIFPNALLGELADHIGGDKVSVETAGSFRGGKRVWLLCRDEGADWEAVPGDYQKGYALLTVGHDATQALTVVPTSVRVVCANTHRMALSARHTRMYKWNHWEDLDKGTMFEAARNAILQVREAATVQRDTAKYLVSQQMDSAKLNEFFAEVYHRLYGVNIANPVPLDPKARDKALDHIACWRGLLDKNTNSLAGMRGTKWAAVNAVTEWICHHRRTRGDRNIQNLMGGGAEMTQRVFELAMAS